MDETLKRLTKQGQWVGDVPRDRSVEFLVLFKVHFPNREYALIGNDNVSLIVFPPLSHCELEAWETLCDKRLQGFELEGND